ncbi:lipoprotein [Devosia limi DSM 17137]|uniref:Lipoprotein n=1 Tax=Devosia limi DSM 17137 TaxID=1121477 RepID=A0A0F5LTQ6_9HYPH|nr:lipoprotein [Devosia limi]KKB85671.1 lipoprotein [Devosia limi DSM 17137]SHE43878.1 Predicted lipoprotein with conserved Yx(FWY)xxD motif [Devosia limi DSM 17137]
MNIRLLLAGVAALGILAMPAFAEDYLGGAVKSVDIGGKQVLTDANGMTLYIFDKDTAGVTNCYDKCAVNWPPLMADAAAAPEGDFSIVDRTDGTKMWAYKSMPLYFWKDDKAPGDVTGDGVGGVWHLAIE